MDDVLHVLSSVQQFLAGLNWGDVAGWVQAIGNVAVLAIALVTLRRDARRITALEAKAELERTDAAALRVAGVAAWPEKWGNGQIEIKAVNESDGPIYDVAVRVATTSDSLPSFDSSEPNVKRVILIAPRERFDAVVAAVEVSGQQAPFVEIRFRDTSGRVWVRNYAGALSEIPRIPENSP